MGGGEGSSKALGQLSSKCRRSVLGIIASHFISCAILPDCKQWHDIRIRYSILLWRALKFIVCFLFEI